MLLYVSILLALQGATPAHDPAARARSGIRGQAIAGRVTDSSGRAVAGVVVAPLHDSDEAGAPRLRPVDVRLVSVTDANGEFRLENLPPDNYCLVAFPRNPSVGRGYAITYYPSATKAADARSVMVTSTAGATAHIKLAPAHLSTIAGSVTDFRGQPARGSRLLLAHGDGLFGLGGMSTTTAEDGTFRIEGLPPGTYFLHMREGAWPPPRDAIPRVSVATVSLADRDVTNVRVQALPMVRATGRIVIDPALRPSLPADLRIGSVPLDGQGNPGPDRPGTVHPDLTFEFHSWPARRFVVVASRSGWSISRVRLNGVDVTKSGIDFRAGHDVAGLEIELINTPAR